MEITPEIRGIDFQGRVWAYLVLEKDRASMIDTGIGGNLQVVLDGMSAAKRGARDLRQIVATHCHQDDTGLLAELRRISGATVLAHTRDAAVIRGQAEVGAPQLTEPERQIFEQVTKGMPAAEPVSVDRELEDGDVVEIGGEYARVVHLPGHTPGSIGVFMPRRRVLFTGDAVASLAGRPVLGFFNVDPDVARRSFARLAELDFETACFGHGPPLLKDAALALRREAERLAGGSCPSFGNPPFR